MKYRNFGNTELKVSEIGLGCNKLGRSVFDSHPEKNNIKLVEKAHDLGINIFDLSPSYNFGDTERMIGKVFKTKRSQVIYSTKVGRMPSSLAKYAKLIRPFSNIVRPILLPFRSKLKKASIPRFDFSEKQINNSLQLSLKQLQTDYIDIFLLHNPSVDVLKNGSVFDVLEKLKQEGQIRYYGVSIDTLEEAKLAMQYPISALQISFNIIQQEMALQLFEDEANIKKLGIMIKTPLLRGLISSKQYLKKEYFNEDKANQILLKNQALDFLQENRQWNHIGLNFVLEQKLVSTTLCGTSSIEHLQDNLNYQNMVAFTKEELLEIENIQLKYSF